MGLGFSGPGPNLDYIPLKPYTAPCITDTKRIVLKIRVPFRGSLL